MSGTRELYTAHPRPVLWLVPEGEAATRDGSVVVEPFYLSQLPVSNKQLEAFAVERSRSALSPGDDDPAVGVSYELACAYCEWYARISRKRIRLPRALEWEHACRGGASGRWFWGEDAAVADDRVWHRGNCGDVVPPLAAKGSNGFGLYAMLGGVWEWVDDARGPRLCGGSWRTPLSELDCGARRTPAAGDSLADVGFRIARSLRG